MGIEVAYSPRGYLLSRSKYVLDIQELVVLLIIRLLILPLRLMQSTVLLIECMSYHTLYHIIVRSLVYLRITRPNIAYVVHIVSQFVASPTTIH